MSEGNPEGAGLPAVYCWKDLWHAIEERSVRHAPDVRIFNFINLTARSLE